MKIISVRGTYQWPAKINRSGPKLTLSIIYVFGRTCWFQSCSCFVQLYFCIECCSVFCFVALLQQRNIKSKTATSNLYCSFTCMPGQTKRFNIFSCKLRKYFEMTLGAELIPPMSVSLYPKQKTRVHLPKKILSGELLILLL